MDLDNLIKQFAEDYQQAPLYGSYSRVLKRRVSSKGDVQRNFIENIMNLRRLTTDPQVEAKIDAILVKFQ
jgi:hypothetical protein